MNTFRINRLTFTIAAAVLALSLALLAWAGRGRLNQAPKAAVTSKPAQVKDLGGITNSAASKAVSMSASDRQQMFEEWVKGKAKYASVAAADKQLSFKLKSPMSGATGKLFAVYIDDNGGQLPASAVLYYGDNPVKGIVVKAEMSAEKFDAAKNVAARVDEKNKDELKTNNVPYLVDINGHTGEAWAPGYNLINGEKYPKPGHVTWQTDDGVVYDVGGTRGENATSMKTLLEIARSTR